MLLWLMLMAQAVTPDVPVDAPAAPFETLHGVVVDAIRNCMKNDGEIVVCSRDRGFAEGQRLPKIVKPKPPPDPSGIKVQVMTGDTTAPATQIAPK